MLKLDEYDLKILAILQKDGRITKTGLAEKINLSPSPTWERLRRLEQEGVISGYQAIIDLKMFSTITTVMVEVMLRQHNSLDFKRFEECVSAKDEVVECLATGGGVDYLMRVITADVDAYQRFMDGLLDSNIGIERYFSYIVTKQVKEYQTVPSSFFTEEID